MTDRLARIGPIFDAVAVASAGAATSVAVHLPRGGLESLLFKATSASGTAAVKLEYTVSEDGVTYGDFADYPDLIADTSAVAEFPTVDALRAVAMANPLAQYLKFKVTGLAANPADTIVTMHGLIREES